MLERDTRGHCGRQLLAETLTEEAAEDHHALVVGRSRQPRLALDVNHAGLAERDRRGDARGAAEAVAADVEHREPVDLARQAALEMNDQRALGDEPADLFFDEVEPQDALVERAIDMACADLVVVRLACVIRGLAREVVDRLHHAKQPVAVARLAHPELHDPRERAAVELGQPLGLRQRGHA